MSEPDVKQLFGGGLILIGLCLLAPDLMGAVTGKTLEMKKAQPKKGVKKKR